MAKKAKPDIWPGMTVKRFDKIGRYIRLIADDLGLKDWVFKLSHDPLTDAVDANVTVVKHRRIAWIRLHQDWRQRTREEQRHLVVHELLHIHLWYIDHRFEWDGQIAAVLGRPITTVLEYELTRDIEQATDAIAYAVARHYPLP